MSHGSYDLNLVSKIWILAGDIRSRSWPNISDSYGICKMLIQNGCRFITHSTTISTFGVLLIIAEYDDCLILQDS